jgi:hypothetical protein
VRRADNPISLMCRLSRNTGALTFRTPQGHVGLFRGYFTFTLLINILRTGHTLFIMEVSVYFGAIYLKHDVFGYQTERITFAEGIPYHYLLTDCIGRLGYDAVFSLCVAV